MTLCVAYGNRVAETQTERIKMSHLPQIKALFQTILSKGEFEAMAMTESLCLSIIRNGNLSDDVTTIARDALKSPVAFDYMEKALSS